MQNGNVLRVVPENELLLRGAQMHAEKIKGPSSKKIFFACKKVFDLGLSAIFIPLLALVAAILMVLNPFFNRGPLFYVQKRMGLGCKPFNVIKFRSMLPAKEIHRLANDPLEVSRITKLGRFIRKTRIDEIPQVINILKGEMSFIGPRPDYFEHAKTYIDIIPKYRARHKVLPGISGLAQTEVGYVQGIEGTKRKVGADLYYIKNSGFRLEAWIIWRTFQTVFGAKGS